MSIEVRIPKEITEYKEKILFGLSLRQLICFSAAIVTGVVTYYFTNSLFGPDIASYIVILLTIPIFAVGFFKKGSFTFEKYIALIIKHYIGTSKRKYKTEISDEIIGTGSDGNDIKSHRKSKTKKREFEGFKVTKKGRKKKSKIALNEIKAARQDYRRRKQENYKAAKKRSCTAYGTANNKISENV